MTFTLNVEETILIVWAFALFLNFALGLYGMILTKIINKKKASVIAEPYVIKTTRHPGFGPAIIDITLVEPAMVNLKSNVPGAQNIFPDKLTNLSPEAQEAHKAAWKKLEDQLKEMQKGKADDGKTD